MKAVTVKELKNRLSSYLDAGKNGEGVLVTDRCRVVAELRRPSSGAPLGLRDHRATALCGFHAGADQP